MRVGQEMHDWRHPATLWPGCYFFFFLFFGLFVLFFWPLAHGLGFLPSSPFPPDQSPVFLRSQGARPSILSVLLWTSDENVGEGKTKEGDPTSWLMQRHIVCSTHLYEPLHYSPGFPGELLGCRLQPAAPDRWLTGLAVRNMFNISRTEGCSACRVQCQIRNGSGSPWNAHWNLLSDDLAREIVIAVFDTWAGMKDWFKVQTWRRRFITGQNCIVYMPSLKRKKDSRLSEFILQGFYRAQSGTHMEPDVWLFCHGVV